MLDLYKNIKTERLKKGWTQTDLAHKIGYSDKSMIAKIEAGKVDLPQTKIRMFAQVFNCTESYLMGWDEEPNNPMIQDLEARKNNGDTTAQAFYDAIDPNFNAAMSVEEYKLIRSYRELDEESKRQLVLMLAFLKEQNNKK